MDINRDHDPEIASQETATAVVAEAEAEAEAPPKRGGGPRTSEGIEQSKRNSYSHGLTAKKVFDKELAAEVARCTAEVIEEFRPVNEYQFRLADDLGRLTAQLDRCTVAVLNDLSRQAWNADNVRCWDEQRGVYVNTLAARLGKDPLRVRLALERTKQGTEWLLLNWRRLADVVRDSGCWTEDQRQLAFDLMGYTELHRIGSKAVPAGDDTQGLAALAAREIARQEERMTSWLVENDEQERLRVRDGFLCEEDDKARKLRQYQASLTRDRNRTRRDLLRSLHAAEGNSGSTTTTTATAAMAPAKAKTLSTGVVLPVPDVLPSRPVPTKAAKKYLLDQEFLYNEYLIKKSRGQVGSASPARVAEPASAPAPAPAPASASAPKAPPTRREPIADARRDADRARREQRAREKKARKASRKKR